MVPSRCGCVSCLFPLSELRFRRRRRCRKEHPVRNGQSNSNKNAVGVLEKPDDGQRMKKGEMRNCEMRSLSVPFVSRLSVLLGPVLFLLAEWADIERWRL